VSIREQIALLEQLQSIDTNIRRLEEHLEKQRGGLSGLQVDLKDLEARLGTDRETVVAMEKTRNELATEARQMQNQIERSREKLQRSRNERESNAAQREMEELRKLHRDREDEAERLRGMIEQARVSIDSSDAKRTSIAAQLEGTQEGVQSSIGELSRERDENLAARATVVAKIPSMLYRRYESIRTKRPVAIAKTHDGTCLGCHLSVPPMMFQKMRQQDNFEQCPQCRRILYYVPPPSPEAPADSASKT
jgi:hypothetical protein